MNKDLVEITHHQTFESLREEEDGSKFWSARKLSKALEYYEYRNFLPVVEKAKEACKNSGHAIEDHFVQVNEMVGIGSGGRRQITDVRLSRYACYLVVQNGDPSKPVIANGQTYFAIQTRRQELADKKILDHMGSTELAANLFRATQAEEKLRRDNIQGKNKANQTHYEVGRKVRQTINELGDT